MKKFFAYFSAPLFLVFLAMILWTCGGGGGGGGGTQPLFSQADLAGTADVIDFSTGNDFGWARYNVSLDGSGNITLNSGTDSTGFTLPGPLPLPIKWVVDGSGTIREYDTSSTPNVINPALYGHLASNKRFVVVTDSDFFLNTWSLIVARKRDASITFSDGDIRGKSFTYHEIYGGPENVWTYGFGAIDSLGRVTLDNAVEPSGVLPGYPLVNFTTLTVDSAGIVTNPPDNDFYGWLTHDKNTIFAIIDDPAGHSLYQFIAIQFLGHTYVQADLAGTWRWNTFYGWNTPDWLKGAWTIDATGAATYDATNYLSSFGSTVPPTTPEVLTLAANGIITNSVSSTYHGMLSAGGDLYVRTKTTGTVSIPRYSIAIAVK